MLLDGTWTKLNHHSTPLEYIFLQWEEVYGSHRQEIQMSHMVGIDSVPCSEEQQQQASILASPPPNVQVKHSANESTC